MKKFYPSEGWHLDKIISNSKRFADIAIRFKYPDIKQFINLKPKERVKAIDKVFQENFNKLIDIGLLDSYEPPASKKRPDNIKSRVKYTLLSRLNNLDFINGISINSIDHATFIKKEQPPEDKYFCVKMTVIIEVEDLSLKKQDIETRFVLVKADSFEDAYEKVEQQQDNYVEPYINPNGHFVRWRIDSYDDCFITDITGPGDINDPKGIEVYSKLSTRKAKNKKVWDGKF